MQECAQILAVVKYSIRTGVVESLPTTPTPCSVTGGIGEPFWAQHSLWRWNFCFSIGSHLVFLESAFFFFNKQTLVWWASLLVLKTKTPNFYFLGSP